VEYTHTALPFILNEETDERELKWISRKPCICLAATIKNKKGLRTRPTKSFGHRVHILVLLFLGTVR